MAESLLTDKQVGTFLASLGNYRVKRAQEAALVGSSDGISGSLLLALGLRESHGKNVEGGAKYDEDKKKWVAQDDPNLMDVGWLQISRAYHKDALKRMLGVKAGTWTPVVAGKTAADGGYCPRFEESLQFAINELRESQAYGEDNKVPIEDLTRFAVAAHNAGAGGALKGYKNGDVDEYTTLGDYSSWVLATREQVHKWLTKHPGWLV